MSPPDEREKSLRCIAASAAALGKAFAPLSVG
jgi:hypothetical protein